MRIVYSTAGILGRMSIAILFIASALYHFGNWAETEQKFFHLLSSWAQDSNTSLWVREFFLQALSWSTVIFACALLIELVGGLFIFLGIQVRLGAFLLILFLIAQTLLVHPLWLQTRDNAWTLFFHNASLLGGLLVLFSVGKHKSS